MVIKIKMQDYVAKKPNSSVNHRLIWDISKVNHRIKEDIRQGLGAEVVMVIMVEATGLAEVKLKTRSVPVTKLGRLIKDMKIRSLEEIYLFSLPTKESEIIDFFPGSIPKG
ncbi:hypothetical protein U0070_024592 [Myodes glareolus]|uniref:Uncharacterized protein n=1 Tax=Myodes glareolus TaxID=447135 RepID=A0AAW0IDC8_MYOGA